MARIKVGRYHDYSKEDLKKWKDYFDEKDKRRRRKKTKYRNSKVNDKTREDNT